MKKHKNSPSKMLTDKSMQHYLPQTTLTQIQSSRFTNQNSLPSSIIDLLASGQNSTSSQTSHSDKHQHVESSEYMIADIYGKKYMINYSSGQKFQNSIQKIKKQNGIKNILGVKVVLLERISRQKPEIQPILQNAIEQYSKSKFFQAFRQS